ncbi:hypothetical protein FQN60_009413 [Etheostoma spectabile]|uniref:Uncharacterized protein n=1 Tax=Etheostoma spectabile TaxID=54343 RepID=A0A5J5DIV6_9PERO|nr:hypothetical protein FQN60_009413 [Etheostoma spectabile]
MVLALNVTKLCCRGNRGHTDSTSRDTASQKRLEKRRKPRRICTWWNTPPSSSPSWQDV